MTSIIKLEALSGVQDDGPLCYLLQVDQVHFLLDCGWDERFDMAYMDAVKRRAPQIDAVLLSYADVAHLGALPYLVRKCGLNCPIYATVPVYKMGQMFLYDWFLAHNNVQEFTHFTLDDIDAAFDRVQQIKHSQTVSLKGRGHGLQITPLPAGHMIGGSIWRITKMGDEEIVYAVDFNHKKERHLNGCTFEGIGRPNLLITDAFNALYQQPRRKQRDEELVTKLLGTVRNGGDVLVVIDTAGRVLEIAHLLDQLWHNAEAGLITYNLVMMSNVASSVVEFAKSQVEWMSDKILKAFEEGRYNPFQFRHVQLCHTQADLNRVRSPKVVLASGLDMEAGYSRELFLEWCADSKNAVIVTGRSEQRTLGSKLIHIATGGSNVNRHLTLEIKRRIRLEGAELEQYRLKRREKEQEAARIRLENARRQSRLETVESSDESDTEDLETPAADHPYDVTWKWEQQQKSSFFKQNKKSFPMYTFIEEKVKWDDYGEIIRPEDFTLVDSVVPHAEHVGALSRRESVEMGGQVMPNIDSEGDIPTKCISYVSKLEFRLLTKFQRRNRLIAMDAGKYIYELMVMCQVAFIDFEGRSDGESVKKILSQIKPKQLILVHGSAAATRHLAQYCELTPGIVQGRVFTPRLGEIVDATIESHIFQVTLSDALMSSLLFQPVKDAELSWIDARLHRRAVLANSDVSATGELLGLAASSGASSSAQHDGADRQMAQDGADEAMDVSTRLEGETAAETFCLETLAQIAIPSHQAVFVNDPKLSDLKQLLMANGFQAEFSSGVLYVNNIVSVKRNEAGKFRVEGCACEEYYRIRELIYGQFAIV